MLDDLILRCVCLQHACVLIRYNRRCISDHVDRGWLPWPIHIHVWRLRDEEGVIVLFSFALGGLCDLLLLGSGVDLFSGLLVAHLLHWLAYLNGSCLLMLLIFERSIVWCSFHVRFEGPMLVELVCTSVDRLDLIDLFKEAFDVGIVHTALNPLLLMILNRSCVLGAELA